MKSTLSSGASSSGADRYPLRDKRKADQIAAAAAAAIIQDEEDEELEELPRKPSNKKQKKQEKSRSAKAAAALAALEAARIEAAGPPMSRTTKFCRALQFGVLSYIPLSELLSNWIDDPDDPNTVKSDGIGSLFLVSQDVNNTVCQSNQVWKQHFDYALLHTANVKSFDDYRKILRDVTPSIDTPHEILLQQSNVWESTYWFDKLMQHYAYERCAGCRGRILNLFDDYPYTTTEDRMRRIHEQPAKHWCSRHCSLCDKRVCSECRDPCYTDANALIIDGGFICAGIIHDQTRHMLGFDDAVVFDQEDEHGFTILEDDQRLKYTEEDHKWYQDYKGYKGHVCMSMHGTALKANAFKMPYMGRHAHVVLPTPEGYGLRAMWQVSCCKNCKKNHKETSVKCSNAHVKVPFKVGLKMDAPTEKGYGNMIIDQDPSNVPTPMISLNACPNEICAACADFLRMLGRPIRCAHCDTMELQVQFARAPEEYTVTQLQTQRVEMSREFLRRGFITEQDSRAVKVIDGTQYSSRQVWTSQQHTAAIIRVKPQITWETVKGRERMTQLELDNLQILHQQWFEDTLPENRIKKQKRLQQQQQQKAAAAKRAASAASAPRVIDLEEEDDDEDYGNDGGEYRPDEDEDVMDEDDE